MKSAKRWITLMALGAILLTALTNCVVVPTEPVYSGYEASPPVVVVPRYHVYRPYRHPHGHGWYRHRHRW